jgi:two-component system LytT family sensor kinase
MKELKGIYWIRQLKFYRLLFWISFLFFFGYVIAFENNTFTQYGSIKAILFILPTLLALVVLDKYLIPLLYNKQRFLLFGLTLIGVIALSVLSEFFLERIILGDHPFGKKIKIYENITIISPWIIIGVIIFLIESNYRRTIENSKAELNYLKQQINPHFLLNTHNNIFFLINSDPTLAASMLLKLSAIMKYTLYECSDDLVLLEKEIQNLENYIELEKIRKDDNFVIDTRFSSEANNFKIAPLILITFLENAFKHVSNFNDKLNSITASLQVANGCLFYNVSNTVNNNKQEKTGGIGLENVKKRLALLYPKRHQLKIINQNEMFTVTLTINLKND